MIREPSNTVIATVLGMAMATAGYVPTVGAAPGGGLAYVVQPPPPPPPEGGEDVDALNARAIETFKAKRYDEAVRLFEQAYAMSPEPNYLFNIGRVYEEKGDFPSAIEHYERFIKQPGVELSSRELALERLRVLRAIVAETALEQAKASDDAPAVREQPVVPDEPEPRPKTPPLRVAGYVLMSLGGAVLVTGAGFGGAAVRRDRELENLETLEERDDAITRGERNALAADILFISGGVVALTGLVLTLISLRKGSQAPARRASIAPVLGRHGTGASIDVRF